MSSYNLHYEKIGDEVKCIEDEIPFEIPDSWEWARASSVGTMQRGSGIKRAEIKTSGKGCIRYGELYTTYDFSLDAPNSFITDDLFKKSKKIIRNDLVFTLTGENKKDIAKCAAYLGTECIAGGGDLAIWSNHLMNPLYISCYMASPIAIEYKQSLATGDIIIHISCDKVGSFLMPIPPRKEQDVIVEKYLSLTQLIQSYSSVEEKLYVLNSTYKEQLAKSILQYAIEGKLVEQDPNDEPVSVLLDRIKQEKNKLINEGKIKKDKNESFIFKRDNSYYENINGKEHCIDDEIPFNIPDSWRWCRLNTITLISMGSSPKGETLNQNNDGIEFHQGKTLFSDKYLNTNNVFTNKPTIIADVDSVLMCVRAPVGKVNITKRKICIGRGLSSIKGLSAIDSEYLFYFLLTYEKYLCSISTGSTFKAINSNQVKQILFPLAPLQEQKRIVEQIHIIFDLL